MLKGQKKHIDKEQGKTKHEAPRSINYRATQNKNNIGTTALERSVVYTTEGREFASVRKYPNEGQYSDPTPIYNYVSYIPYCEENIMNIVI